MKYIVYKTTNKVNNKIYIGVHKTALDIFDGYIGCGINIYKMKKITNPKTPFHYAVIKYGFENFYRDTLFVFDTAKDAYNKEREIVNYDFINREDTYNAKIGGLGGYNQEVKIFQFDFNGKLIKSFNSIVEAAIECKCSHTAIQNAINSNGSSMGFFWSKNEHIHLNDFSSLCKRVYMYDLSGKYEGSFPSIKDASVALCVTGQSISGAIHRKCPIKKHYFSDLFIDSFKVPKKIIMKNKVLKLYLDGNFIGIKSSSELYSFFHIKQLGSIAASLRTGNPYKGYTFQIINDIV